jgi:hypothetical protein
MKFRSTVPAGSCLSPDRSHGKTHGGEGEPSREINTLKKILRQSYGLGSARIYF